MIEYLLKACDVVERGAIVETLRRVLFVEGRMRAYNGMLEYQAPSGLDPAESFSLAEAKLASALRACGPDATIQATDMFLRVKKGPLGVRVKKMPAEGLFYDRISVGPSVQKQSCGDLLLALKRVLPFISSDASRPWSVAAKVSGGYVWATNNLSLVRTKLDVTLPDMVIPLAAVQFLAELPSLDYYDIDERGRLVFVIGRQLVRTPQSAAPWPDISAFFDGFPAVLAPVPANLLEAATTVKRFADRFISLDAKSMKGGSETVEAEYEIDFEKGCGMYSAALLALILDHATHADFSFYPKPVYFRSEAIEGVATGARQV